MAGVAHNTDDGVGFVVGLDVLSQRLLAGKEFLRQALADDDFAGLIEAQTVVEGTPAQAPFPGRVASWSCPPRTRACGPGRCCGLLAGCAPGRDQGVQGLVQGAGRP